MSAPAAMGVPPPLVLFERLKAFLEIGDQDIVNLRAMVGVVEKHGPGITDRFYQRLEATPETAKLIAGRVDSLKKTHFQWMRSLVTGPYDEAYLASRWRIGLAHVRIGLDPYWVESVISFIRTSMLDALVAEVADAKEVAVKYTSFVKVCDLDLLVINLSYAEDRLDRISEFTGMKRVLIENIIRIAKK